MARLQDFQSVTPSTSDNLLIVQATGQGLANYGSTIGNKAPKSDLASISIIGSTNNTGSTIKAGTFFYWQGVLRIATTDIGTGATISTSSNCSTIVDGALNLLNVSAYQALNSSSMTFDTGVELYSGGRNEIFYCGNLAIVSVAIKMTGMTVNRAVSIGNYLPRGFRPQYSMNYNGETGIGDGKNQSFNISNNGLLKIFPCNAGTTYCIGTAIYFRYS